MSDSSSSDIEIKPRNRKQVRPAAKMTIARGKPEAKRRPQALSESESSDSYSSSESGLSSESESEAESESDNERKGKSQKVNKTEVSHKGFVLPTKEEEPKIFVLCGSCASGKSWMLRYLMYLYAKSKMFSFGLCFTQTAYTGDYSYLPEKSVKEFDMDYLESYIKHLRAKIEAGKEQHGKKWNLPHNFVIIDDSIGLVTSSSFFINFIGTHRHTRTTIFLLSQLLTAARSVNTVVRANTSFALLWSTSMASALDGLWKSYGQFFTYKEFKEKLDACRERKYSCLLFKNSPDITDPDEAYCSILASADTPDFRLVF
jgi:hypothetical protein